MTSFFLRLSPWIALLILSVFVAAPSMTFAQNTNGSGSGTTPPASTGGTYGLDETAGAAELPGAGGSGVTDLRVVIGNFIKLLLTFLGLVFIIIVMYGGFTWMTAGGESDKVEKAIDLIRNGIIGVVIILSSYIITSFVVDNVLERTGGTATEGD